MHDTMHALQHAALSIHRGPTHHSPLTSCTALTATLYPARTLPTAQGLRMHACTLPACPQLLTTRARGPKEHIGNELPSSQQTQQQKAGKAATQQPTHSTTFAIQHLEHSLSFKKLQCFTSVPVCGLRWWDSHTAVFAHISCASSSHIRKRQCLCLAPATDSAAFFCHTLRSRHTSAPWHTAHTDASHSITMTSQASLHIGDGKA